MPAGVIIYMVWISLSKVRKTASTWRSLLVGNSEITVDKRNDICRFSAKMSITIQIAISLEVPRGRARLPKDTWCTGFSLGFCQLLISLRSHLWGCQMAYLTLEWQPPRQVTGHSLLSPLYMSSPSKQGPLLDLGREPQGWLTSDEHLVFITRGSRGEQGCCSVWCGHFTTIRTS